MTPKASPRSVVCFAITQKKRFAFTLYLPFMWSLFPVSKYKLLIYPLFPVSKYKLLIYPLLHRRSPRRVRFQKVCLLSGRNWIFKHNRRLSTCSLCAYQHTCWADSWVVQSPLVSAINITSVIRKCLDSLCRMTHPVVLVQSKQFIHSSI